MKKIAITQYSTTEGIKVNSDWQEAEDNFYAEWREDIRQEEAGQHE